MDAALEDLIGDGHVVIDAPEVPCLPVPQDFVAADVVLVDAEIAGPESGLEPSFAAPGVAFRLFQICDVKRGPDDLRDGSLRVALIRHLAADEPSPGAVSVTKPVRDLKGTVPRALSDRRVVASDEIPLVGMAETPDEFRAHGSDLARRVAEQSFDLSAHVDIAVLDQIENVNEGRGGLNQASSEIINIEALGNIRCDAHRRSSGDCTYQSASRKNYCPLD
jgi:hypothetical protein